MPNREHLQDTLVDDETVEPAVLVEQLLHSRRLVKVAEYDVDLLEDDIRCAKDALDKEHVDLEGRKKLADAAILSCQKANNDFLPQFFLRYGRSAEEAYRFKNCDVAKVIDALQKKVFLRKRQLGLVTHAKRRLLRRISIQKEKCKDIRGMLDEKKCSGDIMFRTNITHQTLKRVARHTRELIQGMHTTYTFMSLAQDLAGKFERVGDYLYEDHTQFSRLMEKLQERIKAQETELAYLKEVLKDSVVAMRRAEKAYQDTSIDLKKSVITRDEILAEIQDALEDQRRKCDDCNNQLIALNNQIQSSVMPCIKACPEKLEKYPVIKVEADQQYKVGLLQAYVSLKTLLRARDEAELLDGFKRQNALGGDLKAAVDDLEQLLKNVLRPEMDTFTVEKNRFTANSGNRALAAQSALTELQDKYDLLIEESREVVAEALNMRQQFDFMLGQIYALNERIGKTFNTIEQDAEQLSNDATIPKLLELTAKNVHMAHERVGSVMADSWNVVKHQVDLPELLEHRYKKLNHANDRVALAKNQAEDHRAETPTLNMKFTTNKQFKEANDRIIERAKQAELERLKEANEKAEKEKDH